MAFVQTGLGHGWPGPATDGQLLIRHGSFKTKFCKTKFFKTKFSEPICFKTNFFADVFCFLTHTHQLLQVTKPFVQSEPCPPRPPAAFLAEVKTNLVFARSRHFIPPRSVTKFIFGPLFFSTLGSIFGPFFWPVFFVVFW